MARSSVVQMAFPRFESVTVAQAQAPPASAVDPQDEELEKAQHALQRMKEKKRIRALKMELALAESEQQTESLLEQQRQEYERVAHDTQLEELLRLRKAGVSIDDAVARIEGQRRPARAVNNRGDE